VTEYGNAEKMLSVNVPGQGYKGDSVKALQQHLADCLLSGKTCESEGAEYLKTVRAVDACYRSAKTGMPVNLA
jgi:predicted dehydrogenase